MISHTLNVGTVGILEIRDYTNATGGHGSGYVELWVQSTALPAAPITIPWWSVIDGAQSAVQSYFLSRTTTKRLVSRITPPSSSAIFTWHIEDTGSAELDGPQDFTITLQMGLAQAKAYVKVGDIWKKAIPFVKDGGVWKVVTPEVMLNTEWKDVT